MKEKEKTRKPYDTPKLTVLVRGNPEEAVLAACKYTSKAGAGSSNNNCYTYNPGGGGCGIGDATPGGNPASCYANACSTRSAS